MNNYPDDVRQYDIDPRSPFYDDREERYKEILLEMISEDPEIMILALDADPTRFGNIVIILCDLYSTKTRGNDYSSQLSQFIYAWEEIAESVANKRAEEIRNEQ